MIEPAISMVFIKNIMEIPVKNIIMMLFILLMTKYFFVV